MSKLYLFLIPFILFFMGCNSNKNETPIKIKNQEKVNHSESTNSSENNYKYPKPIVIDTGRFYSDEDIYEIKHYHFNAYSKIDSAEIDFYIDWSDSILNVLGGGRRSLVFFFNDEAGTPKIPIPTGVMDEGYDDHCFLYIKYEKEFLKYQWNPFSKAKRNPAVKVWD